jgi:3D-(3,5/4)-trihydroxycyclohexane-1,2-dione acylhydrolase (decyclizing)
MSTIELTTAQALVRALAAQRTEQNGRTVPLFAGVWAIFGHGNVAALGDALYEVRGSLPTFRAHNEQAMAHAAIAYAKALRRRRMMACTTSIGPGATNLVTAAAVAHINRLPVLLLPGDVFASRRPDPVLQQLECFGDGTQSVNDCLRPVSRYFDRLTRPEQLAPAIERALNVLTDPAACGPVTLALCQDVQGEAHKFPSSLFEVRTWTPRRPPPDQRELSVAANLIRAARRPLVVVGGGVLYSEAEQQMLRLCEKYGIPAGETQAGKSALPAAHPLNLGAIGVTGTAAANALAREADVILAVGTRLQDFTTGSRSLFASDARTIGLNVSSFDAAKHGSEALVADAQTGLVALDEALSGWRAPQSWTDRAREEKQAWTTAVAFHFSGESAERLSDAHVINALQRAARPTDVVVCAAGGLPGDLHKLWQAAASGGYHAEYGYSCMGYEIAGGLGVKLAFPDREVFVLLGDGSYLMMNSELATSVMLNRKLIVILLDNHGFGCIHRLQQGVGGATFNNLLAEGSPDGKSSIDFVAHARSLGAHAERLDTLKEFEAALIRARSSDRTCVIVIETDARASLPIGGYWWDVPVPELSSRVEVRKARAAYEAVAALRELT